MRYACIGWLCLLLAVAGAVGAAVPGGIPAQTTLLTDEADVLTVEEHAALLARLLAIQRSGRAQIAVLISNGTGGVPLADYALRVAEAWQIGRARRDDGLLILIVPSINGARLEVGYGLEGAIPDARASQWLDDLIPAIRNKQFAEGLDQLLTRIDAALPLAEPKTASEDRNLFEKHPEWGVPFVLVVFSLFSLFPLFLGRSGGVASAFLLAAFMGGAAWTFWESRTAGLTAAAAAFPLPILWGLNRDNNHFLKPWLRYAKAFGNLIGVGMFFAIITLFVCTGLSVAEQPVWPGLFFSGLLAIGLAIFLFPGKPADYLSYFLRSAMH
ncbi:MAG TPA: TPM domain-containing protein, partial [Burkholderiales bacterium]|nr:TPM domain-containing protein [Burkholderiales bacterium]